MTSWIPPTFDLPPDSHGFLTVYINFIAVLSPTTDIQRDFASQERFGEKRLSVKRAKVWMFGDRPYSIPFGND